MSRINYLENDFIRKYRHTFIRFVNPMTNRVGDWVVGNVREIVWDEDSDQLRLSISTRRLGAQHINVPSTTKLNFEFPNVGMFQVGGQALMFSRHPARQWRRGLCEGNATFRAVTPFSNRARWDFEVVEAAFEGRSFSWKEALMMIQSPTILSVAVNGGFAITKTPNVGEIEVHHGAAKVGTFTNLLRSNGEEVGVGDAVGNTFHTILEEACVEYYRR